MIDATHTVTIDRPVDEVFDFVAESSNEPRWNVDVADVIRPKRGKLAAGMTWEYTVKFLGTKQLAGEVTAFEPNRRIELTTHEGPILPVIIHTFEAEGNRTVYTRQSRFQTSGLLKLIEPLINRLPDSKNPNARTARNLKLVLEGGQPR